MPAMSRLLLSSVAIAIALALRAEPVRASPARDEKFPVMMPEYAGVDQLLVLSSRWVIVVTSDIAEVVKKIDELSGGELMRLCDAWDASAPAGKPPDWNAYHGRGKVRDTYLARARELCGERDLGTPETFAVTSANDSRYAGGRTPLRATRVIVGLGGCKVRGGPPIHYAHYSYLELPEPMVNGARYAIALKNGKKVTFLYDEMRTVSRAIKVNQAGYLPDAGKKFAYLGCHLYEFGPMDFSGAKEFKVVSAATGEIACAGEVRLRDRNRRFAVPEGRNDAPGTRPLMFGEDVYELDLAGLEAEGEFFIVVPGVGRSWTFRHARDAYGEAFYVAARGFYHQRCGIAYEAPYTAWKRIKCHTAPVYECEHVAFGFGDMGAPAPYEVFDVIGGSLSTAKKTEGVVGGWHDAADWDRNIYHYSAIFDMLYAYELAPARFTDGQLDIPESANGIPDILDEAEFGLNVWTLSMDERGGVAGMVETRTHPKIDADEKYAFSRRTRWSSLAYAAAAAQLAQLVEPFDAARSGRYKALALKAYAFGSDPRSSLGRTVIHAAKNRGQGERYTIEWEEKDAYSFPHLTHARVRLFLLTNDKAYLDGLPALVRQINRKPFEWPNTYGDPVPWFYFHIAKGAAGGLPAGFVKSWRDFYVAQADALVAELEAMPYRHSWPVFKDFWMGWGAYSMHNRARPLWIAYALTGDAKYRDAAICNADYMLGANALGISWTTGIGFVYPVDIQHEVSETDRVLDPVPGITIYGIDGGGMGWDLRRYAWGAPTGPDAKEITSFVSPDVPVLRRWSCHPSTNTAQCEFTVHETMASALFNCAMLMAEGWTPSAELKARAPRRDELVLGYYYLP